MTVLIPRVISGYRFGFQLGIYKSWTTYKQHNTGARVFILSIAQLWEVGFVQDAVAVSPILS